MSSNSWGERKKWIEKDKAVKKERGREKKAAVNSAIIIITPPPPPGSIQHWSHSHHPLTYVQQPHYQRFRCNACDRRGEGKRYHCAPCEFDLHLTCAQIHVTRLVHHMTTTEMDAALGDQRGTIINDSFVHPGHKLVPDYNRQSFMCAHCNNQGDGLRFRCHVCGDVQFHQVCAKNPTKITSHLFPAHELQLKLSRPLFTKCKLCGDGPSISSLMYGCKECKFYLHPGCTQWPLYLAHPLHPPHPLLLKPCGADGSDIDMKCSACDQTIGRYNLYKYGCKLCGLDFHLSCILRFSKLGMGRSEEEVVKSECYPVDQCFGLLPVTNLVLPDFDWKKPNPSPGIRWGYIGHLSNDTSSWINS